MRLENKLGILLLLFFSFMLFRFFFSGVSFVAHDFPLLFKESRNFFPFWAISWDYMGAGGIGASAFKTMWIDLYTNFVYFVSNFLNIPWWLSQRIFWLVPFILISLVSSYKFAGLFIKDPLLRASSCIIYSFNTYILLVIGGGQFGIAFAYALAPIALYGLFKLFEKSNIRNLIFSSLISGLLIAFDPRIAILTFGICVLWYLFFVRKFSLRNLSFILVNLVIANLLNSYWILPAIYAFITNSVPSTVSSFGSLAGVKFLSFANFENSISFLHPNWPENIFGKTYFQDPAFLLLPILAFSALLFKQKKEILFFAILGLFGIFLGKGANEPFGQIYLFLVDKIPGFAVFRDLTKFYMLIAISFAVLIPFFLQSISLKFAKYKIIIASLFFVYYLFILRAGWMGDLKGVFKPAEIPQEYRMLNNNMLRYSLESTENEFSRSLWIPRRQKYGYFDPKIPAVDSEVFFKGRDIGKVTEKELHDLSIKYVIVPSDPDGEIFLKDRKYDDKLRNQTIQRVEKIGLNSIVGFGDLTIYSVTDPKDHFWCDCNSKIDYKFVNPTTYEASVRNAKKGDVLVFSEGFDKDWIAKSSKFKVQSSKFGNLNSFVLPEGGGYELMIYYEPQKWVNIGLIISTLTLLSLISAIFVVYSPHGRKGKRAISRVK